MPDDARAEIAKLKALIEYQNREAQNHHKLIRETADLVRRMADDIRVIRDALR